MSNDPSLRMVPTAILFCVLIWVFVIAYIAYFNDKVYPDTDCGYKSKEECDGVSYCYWSSSSGGSCTTRPTLEAWEVMILVFLFLGFIVGMLGCVIWCFVADRSKAREDEICCSRYEMCGYKLTSKRDEESSSEYEFYYTYKTDSSS